MGQGKELDQRYRIDVSLRGGKVPLGEIRITPAARDRLSYGDVSDALLGHFFGEWGELDEYDWRANDDALEFGGRLRSRFRSRQGTVFFVTTEEDRSVTRVYLQEDDQP